MLKSEMMKISVIQQLQGRHSENGKMVFRGGGQNVTVVMVTTNSS
jgi:hypothetical protein